MPIRLLHIIPTLDLGGAEKQLALLAAGLPRDEFDVQVCCLTRGGPREADLQAANIPVEIIGKRRKVDPQAYRRLKQHILEIQPDIVHTWLFAANAYGRKAAISAGVKHIVAGERCVDRWKRWPHFAIDRWLAKRTDRIVTNSAGVREFYAAHGISREKFTVIPNGITRYRQVAGDNENQAARESICAELQLPPNTKLIGAIGRLWPQKNYKQLLWSMCLLKEIRDDFHLLIFGEGPHRWRLERYRDQIQIADRVTLLGERDDVARFLPALNCFVNASDYEGQSNGIMEAMAAGLTVVASDIPGNRDLVLPKETGYLIEPGDRADMARWVNVLLDDNTLAQRFGEAGRQRMVEHFSVEKMIARHVEMYRSLTG